MFPHRVSLSHGLDSAVLEWTVNCNLLLSPKQTPQQETWMLRLLDPNEILIFQKDYNSSKADVLHSHTSMHPQTFFQSIWVHWKSDNSLQAMEAPFHMDSFHSQSNPLSSNSKCIFFTHSTLSVDCFSVFSWTEVSWRMINTWQLSPRQR